MCSFIERAGHQAVVAESGEQALQLVESTPVDLVIMDVEMPGLDGFETTRLVREFFGDHWVPIIFVTGMSDESSYQKGIEAGGDDYMIKPVSPVILKAKLRAFQRIVEMQQQLQELNQELQDLSQKDGLTELFNRRAYEEKADVQWQISTRAREAVAVLMVDVDHFKDFNDQYGHQAGDDCLRKVARTLLKCLHRPADILARYGGEEFIILLPDTDLDGALTVAETMRSAVQSLGILHEFSSSSDVVTVSIGGAVTEHTSGITHQQLAAEADEALYRAKGRGRNCVELIQLSPHKTVLVASPDPNELAALSDSLFQRCNVITSNSRKEGLEIAHNCRPDLILLGRNFSAPELQAFRENLQKNQATRKIPVLLMESLGETGGEDQQTRGEWLKEIERGLA